MKNVKFLGIGLGLVLALSACNTSAEKKTTSEKEKQIKTEQKQTHPTDSQNLTKRGAHWNSGERWKVNDEMVPHLRAAEKALEDYQTNGSNKFSQLAEELKKHNDQLISSCTMKGESHEQLHLWLRPHIQLIKALSEAKNKEEANKLITELEASFKKYHSYFN